MIRAVSVINYFIEMNREKPFAGFFNICYRRIETVVPVIVHLRHTADFGRTAIVPLKESAWII